MDEREKRSKGRSRMPDTTVVNIRIAHDLLNRIDRYIDSEMQWSHQGDINRATTIRMALDEFLVVRGIEGRKNLIALSDQIWRQS